MRFRLRAGGRALDVDGGIFATPQGAPGLDIDLGEALLMPGLVNAHDHLHRNHLPRMGAPPYASAAEWGADLHTRFADDLARRHMLSRRDALLFGAFKNVLGGATSVVHHDRHEPAFDAGFPIRVVRLHARDALRDAPDAPDGLWTLHLAEGTSDLARAEIAEASSRGLLSQSLLAVHLVGASEDDVALLARSGCAAVWCPTSNQFLYGETSPPALFAADLDVLLGTDALVSGSGTLLHEIRAARALGFLTDTRLTEAVTDVTARRLGLAPPSLAAGAPADLVALDVPLLEALPRDVALVLVRGIPALADARYVDLFEVVGVPYRRLDVGGIPKIVAAPLGDAALLAFRLVKDLRRIVA